MTEELMRMLNTDIEFIRFTASDVIATSDIPGGGGSGTGGGGGSGDDGGGTGTGTGGGSGDDNLLGVFSEAGSGLTDGYTTKVNGFRFGFGSKQ